MEQQDFFEKDFTKLDWLLYGVIYPLAFIACCMLAELMNKIY